MNTPADECGVSGGCGACPMAGLCGDPVPVVATFHLAATDLITLATEGTLSRADAQRVRADVVAVRDAVEQVIYAGTGRDDVTALAEAVGVLTDLDAPDVDPAEPAPAVGCCGGECRG